MFFFASCISRLSGENDCISDLRPGAKKMKKKDEKKTDDNRTMYPVIPQPFRVDHAQLSSTNTVDYMVDIDLGGCKLHEIRP